MFSSGPGHSSWVTFRHCRCQYKVPCQLSSQFPRPESNDPVRRASVFGPPPCVVPRIEIARDRGPFCSPRHKDCTTTPGHLSRLLGSQAIPLISPDRMTNAVNLHVHKANSPERITPLRLPPGFLDESAKASGIDENVWSALRISRMRRADKTCSVRLSLRNRNPMHQNYRQALRTHRTNSTQRI